MAGGAKACGAALRNSWRSRSEPCDEPCVRVVRNSLIIEASWAVSCVSERLAAFLTDPSQLQARAEKAKMAGVTDAAERLADLALKTAEVR